MNYDNQSQYFCNSQSIFSPMQKKIKCYVDLLNHVQVIKTFYFFQIVKYQPIRGQELINHIIKLYGVFLIVGYQPIRGQKLSSHMTKINVHTCYVRHSGLTKSNTFLVLEQFMTVCIIGNKILLQLRFNKFPLKDQTSPIKIGNPPPVY